MKNNYFTPLRALLLCMVLFAASVSARGQNNLTLTTDCGNSVLRISGSLAANNRILIHIVKDGAIVAQISEFTGPSINQTTPILGAGSYFVRAMEVNNDNNNVISPTVAVNCTGGGTTPPPVQPPTPPPSGTNGIAFTANCGNSALQIAGYLQVQNRVNIQIFKDGAIVSQITDLVGPSINQTTPILGAGSYFVRAMEVNNDGNNVTSPTAAVNCTGGGTTPPPVEPTTPPPPSTCSVSAPQGYFDAADCNGAYGWAFDQSDFSKTVTVDIYVDGNKVGSVQANGDRPDLVGAFGTPAARYHGYRYQFPANASWRDGQNHNVTVRICGASSNLGGAIPVNCTGGTTTPQEPPVVPPTTCSVNAPQGSFDAADCNGVYGWAFDQADYDKTLTLDVYVNGNKVGSVEANGDRPDLVGAFGTPAARYHGFRYQFPANYLNAGGAFNVTVRICGTSNDLGGVKVINCPVVDIFPPNPNARLSGVQDDDGSSSCSPNSPETDLAWDWTVPKYDLYFDVKLPAPIFRRVDSPFHFDNDNAIVGVNNPNVNADMFREDGWMFVKRNFGSATSAPIYPSLFLYNKYKGILRVMIFRSVYFPTAYQTLSLTLTGNNSEKPQLMNNAGGYGNIFYGSSDLGLTQTAIVRDAGNFGWMIADFDLSSYDPAINDPKFDFAAFGIRLNEVTDFNVDLKGKITLNGSAEPVVTSSGSSGPSLGALATAGLSYTAKTLDAAKTIVKAGIVETVPKPLEIIANKISAVSGYVGLAIAAKDILLFALGGSGSTAPTPYKIKLEGSIDLTGKINQSGLADRFPLYLKKDVGYCTKPVQDIPWGVVTLYGMTGELVENYEPYPEQYPGSYRIRYANFHLDARLNEALGMSIKAINVKRIDVDNPNRGFIPIGEFDWDYYPVSSYENLNTVVIVELVLGVNSPTRNLGNEVRIYRKVPVTLRSGARKGVDEELVVSSPYPNPSNGRVTIPMSSWSPDSRIDIFDLNGKSVWNSWRGISDRSGSSLIWEGNSLSGQPVSEGMYLIKIQDKDRIQTHKVLIKR